MPIMMKQGKKPINNEDFFKYNKNYILYFKS